MLPVTSDDSLIHTRLPNRLLTLFASALALSGLIIIGPVTGGLAEEPEPITPSVQEIPLGEAEDPADDVSVVPADESPAPAATAEAPSSSGGPSGEPGEGASGEPTTSDPAMPSNPSSGPTVPSDTAASPSDPAASSPSAGPASPSDPTNPAPAPSDELAPGEPMALPEGAQTLVLDPTQTEGFASVGISWLGDAPVNGIALQIRVKDAASGEWSPWTELQVNRDVTPDAGASIRQGSDPYWFGNSAGVEVVNRPDFRSVLQARMEHDEQEVLAGDA